MERVKIVTAQYSRVVFKKASLNFQSNFSGGGDGDTKFALGYFLKQRPSTNTQDKSDVTK